MKSKFYIIVLLVTFLTSKSFAVALNDSCQGATLLIVETSGSLFETLEENLDNSSNVSMQVCAITQNLDLWYYFVATNDTQVVYIESLSSGLIPSLELMSGTCGSLSNISCATNNVHVLTGLVSGQTYYLRTYQQFTGYKYKIALLNVPSNDECSTAYSLNVYRSDQPHIGGLNFWVAASNTGTNLCNSFSDFDIWFKFTATDTAQVLFIDGIAAYLDYELFSGSCGSLVSKQCSDFLNTKHVKFHNLVIGQQYYFRLLTGANNSYPLFKVTLMNPLENDHCAGAITLPMSNSFADDTEVQGDLWFGYRSTGTCNNENDLWYKFSANANSAFVKVQSFTQVSFSVYSGTCGSLTALQCSIPANGKITGLTNGATYYIQLHSSLNTQQYYNIAVTPALNNDDCSGAITIIPGDKLYAEDPVEATTYSATQSQPACAGNADDDVWFKFTAGRANYSLEATPEDASLNGPGFNYELFSGNCGSLTSIKCDTVITDKLDALRNLTIGQTYYLRVFSRATGIYSHFKIAIFKSNDECVDAEELAFTNNPNDANQPIYNTLSATQSLPGCQQNADDDVWFSFTATQTTHSFNVSDYTGSAGPMLEVFSGGCGSLTSLTCVFGGQANANGLTIGQKYYLRAYSSAGAYNRFRLSVFSAPANDEIGNAKQLPVTNIEISGLPYEFTWGATSSFPNYCAGSTVTVVEDVWYYFVAPQTAQYQLTSQNNPSYFDVEAYSSKTNLQSNIIRCGGVNGWIPQSGTINAGDTVWLRVYPNFNNGTYKGNLDLMIYVLGSTAFNDEPTDALNLSFTNNYQYKYAGFNYSLSSVSNSCLPVLAGSPSDAWFKFMAPSLKASIVFDEAEGRPVYLEIFSGTPGSLTSVECSDNILNLPPSLIAGQQYYLRVLYENAAINQRIGIFYNDTLEKNSLVVVRCMSPNLVPNPSAECFTCDDGCKGTLIITGTKLAGYYNTDEWFMATDGSADYMNSCADTYYGGANAPTSYVNSGGNNYLWSDIPPRNGKGYLGMFTYGASNYREYIETELTQTLTPGNSYLVSFYVNKNFNAPQLMNKIGALLTTDKVLVTNNSSSNMYVANLPFEPQVAWNDSFFVQGNKWYNVSAIIVADKPYKYLTIGNFENNTSTSIANTGSLIPGQFFAQAASYINIDDVVVAEVPAVLDDSCKATINSIAQMDVQSKTTLQLYPNPARSAINWNIHAFKNAEWNVEVYSLTGQLIQSTKTKSNSLSVKKYLPGIYFIRISDGESFYSAKFVKAN